jgi:hypothetical protein
MSTSNERDIMPRIRIGTLILLTVLVLGPVGMAKTVAPISQMCGEGGLMRADKMSLLTAGELFTIRVLPETGYFDGPPQNYIQIEWITIAEVLNEAITDSICFADAEADVGGLEDLDYDFSESSMSGSFLLETYRLGIGCFEMLLPHGVTEGGLLLVLGDR